MQESAWLKSKGMVSWSLTWIATQTRSTDLHSLAIGRGRYRLSGNPHTVISAKTHPCLGLALTHSPNHLLSHPQRTLLTFRYLLTPSSAKTGRHRDVCVTGAVLCACWCCLRGRRSTVHGLLLDCAALHVYIYIYIYLAPSQPCKRFLERCPFFLKQKLFYSFVLASLGPSLLVGCTFIGEFPDTSPTLGFSKRLGPPVHTFRGIGRGEASTSSLPRWRMPCAPATQARRCWERRR